MTRLAGLRDFGPLGSLLVPDVRGGQLQAERLADPPAGVDDPWVSSPPRTPTPCPQLERAYDPAPRPAAAHRLLHVDRARVVGSEGVAVEPSSGRPWFETLGSRESNLPKIDFPRAPRWLERRRVLEGAMLVLPTFKSDNYFHFVTDVLTRLYAFRTGDRGLNTGSIRIVLDAAEPPWQREFMRLLGLDARYERMSSRTNWEVERLVVPPLGGVKHALSELTVFPRPVLEWLRATLRAAVGADEAAPMRRLYVSRAGAAWRRVANEDVVAELLRELGFETVRPEELAVAEQLRTFAEAEVVVAPHGAALANLIASSGAAVVELHGPVYLSPCYYGFADNLGLPYWYVVGSPAEPGSLDFAVPEAALSAAVEEAVAVSAGSRP